jgi:hypothetical protein
MLWRHGGNEFHGWDVKLSPNDGFIPSPPIHSTNAHTTEVQNKDEKQDGGAKEDGDDEWSSIVTTFCMNYVS